MKAGLFLTGACNLACNYCYASRCPPKPMSRETLHQSLAFLRAWAWDGLGLTLIGGEPLLCPELVQEAVRICTGWEDTPVALAIATNGTLLDDPVLELCRAHQIQLYLSLDGVREAHDRHRCVGAGQGSFDQVLAQVPAVLRAVPSAQSCGVITPETAGCLGDSVEFLDSLGFRKISLGLDYSAPWCRQDLDALERQYRRAAEYYLRAHREGRELHLSFLDDHIRTWASGGTAVSPCCEMADRMLAIGPSGRLYPCLQFVDRDDGTSAIGDVRAGIDDQARCRVLCHDDQPRATCQACTLESRCFHWCGCSNWRATGNRHQPPAMLCEHERMLIPIADAVAEALYAEGNPIFLRKFYGPE